MSDSPVSPASGERFDGKVAFVAGGYGVIGEGIARALAAQGATVVVAGRDESKATALAQALVATGGRASAVALDARSVASIRAAVETAAARHDGLDLVVNSLGAQREQALLEVTEDAYDEILEVNLKAALFLGQAAARVQIALGRGGRHVHQLSVRAQLGLRGRGHSAYCSSKGGLALMVKQHAMELAPHGINVNGVAPTVVRTPLAGRWLTDPELYSKLLERIPLGRIAEVADVVGPTLFLCGTASSFMTGQILFVDGGITASQ